MRQVFLLLIWTYFLQLVSARIAVLTFFSVISMSQKFSLKNL